MSLSFTRFNAVCDYQCYLLQNLITLVDDQTKYALPLAEKIEISHDTRKFRFRLPSEEHILGLPIGRHVFLSAKVLTVLMPPLLAEWRNERTIGGNCFIIVVYCHKQLHHFYSFKVCANIVALDRWEACRSSVYTCV